jgi:UDPglucose 6-dehydrogenase
MECSHSSHETIGLRSATAAKELLYCIISVIGSGHVGLVTGACLAAAGHEVSCTDIDSERIALLNAGGVPIFEPHLDEILASSRKAGRIFYTADAGEAIRVGDAILICVGTPPKESGEADLSAIEHVVRQIAEEARSPKLVVEKSTVPAGTGLQFASCAYHLQQW